ncbi:sensor histidine kinase [Sediminitomix flava]|uniref:histidine kinase n=1 Tax=Sediminitomix flava TaxID=379075 RepID=A0A315YX96_SEDFL|nr:ATP-binding protein [Sediminitomix flava]PWJ33680.1 signal transduction histidine kinase [Sediminitomix flava]
MLQDENIEEIRILLIDDDEDDYIITSDLIDEIGSNHKYHLDWISSYEEGIETIYKEIHDVYIVDYRLGIHSGLDLIHDIRQNMLRPFILLTGQGDRSLDEKAMQMGAVDYLVKGTIDADTLERSIRHSIQHVNNLRKIQRLNEALESRVEERTQQLNTAVANLQMANQDLQREIKERKRAEQAVRKSQKIYKKIAQNFPGGLIAVLNRQYHYDFIDGKGLEELNVEKESVLNKKFLANAIRNNYSGAELNIYYEILNRVFVKQEEAIFDLELNGHMYAANVVPLPSSDDQEPEQVLMVAKNITEQRRAENEIRKALKKEKELNELKTRFVSMASHEFRTPLSTIMSSVSLISRYTTEEQDEKRQKHIQRIKTSVNNLTQILNDFLSISKLEEEGGNRANFKYINLMELVHEVKEEMSAVKKSGQRILYTHEGDETSIYSDKQHLKNILINLVSNAIKYSSTDKEIKIETKCTDEHTYIKVTDQGIGIPEADQQYLFKRFFRAENAMNIQGTGLGLNIVKKYLDILKGHITFDSKQDVGTTFTITLPKKYKSE